jgi:hypothetical protein
LCLCVFGERQSRKWFGLVECAVVFVCFWCSGGCSCVCVCLVTDRVESGLVYWSAQFFVCFWCSGECSCVCVCLVRVGVEGGFV